MLEIHLGDNLPILEGLADASFELIYIDPPFNTGRTRKHTAVRTSRARGTDPGDRTGFGGRRYSTTALATRAFDDAFDDYLAFLEPRLVELARVLKPNGSLFVHLDYREAHYVKVLLDGIFGRECFMNEIVWAYDYGGRPKRRWPAKHDDILWYAADPNDYVFREEAVDRIPYMAPGLVGPGKAERGKTPTDTWWHTIVPTAGRERTGYPTQKPLGVLRRIVSVHAEPGGRVLDCFAGSGTTGEAALTAGLGAVLVDDNPEAMEVMARRFAGQPDVVWHGWRPGGDGRGVDGV